MRRALLLTTLLALPALAQSTAARETLDRYTELRPGDDDLAMYRLDWAPTLEEGQKRAAKEKKPLLVVVIHAKYGDMITGHC